MKNRVLSDWKLAVLTVLLVGVTNLLYSSPDGGGLSDSVVTGELVRLDHDFAFTEGPTSDKKGNVYFTDQPNNAIWKYELSGKFSLFMQPAGRSNGMIIDKDGNLITCADLNNQLWRVHIKDLKVDTLMTSYKGRLLNGPNDLWMDSHGGIFFTDPYYQRDYWARKSSEQDKACIYYLPKGATDPIRVRYGRRCRTGLVAGGLHRVNREGLSRPWLSNTRDSC